MKKLIFGFMLMAFFMVSCGESTPKEVKEVEQVPELVGEQEELIMDSTTKEIDKVTKDINESGDHLDQLLEDL